MKSLRNKTYQVLRHSERFFKTDMIYLATGGFWINLNVIIVTILSFILSIAFARFLSKEVYGTYQFILSIGTVITALTLTGMKQSIMQSAARGIEGTLRKSIVPQLVHGILPFSLGAAVSLYYLVSGNGALSVAVFISALLLPILNTFNSYLAFIAGRKDYKGHFLFSQLANFPYYVVMLTSLVFVRDPVILVSINLGTGAALALILHFVAIRKYKPNEKEDPAALGYGKHLSFANAISGMISKADNILVYHYLGAIELAIYAFATIVPERIVGLMKSVSMSALPKYSERSRSELKGYIISKSLMLALAALVLALVYIPLAPLLYKYFFPQYVLSVPYSQIYFLMLVIGTLSALPVTGLIATKAKRDIYLYNIFQPLTSLAIMFVMVNLYGLWGLVFSRGISNAISFVILSEIWKK